MTLRATQKPAKQTRDNKGFSVLSVLLLATILSAIAWVGFTSWHQLLRQNKTAGRRLQRIATNCPVQRPRR